MVTGKKTYSSDDKMPSPQGEILDRSVADPSLLLVICFPVISNVCLSISAYLYEQERHRFKIKLMCYADILYNKVFHKVLKTISQIDFTDSLKLGRINWLGTKM